MSPATVVDALPPRRAVTHRLGRTVLGRQLPDVGADGAAQVGLADRALLFLGLQSARHLIDPEGPS